MSKRLSSKLTTCFLALTVPMINGCEKRENKIQTCIAENTNKVPSDISINESAISITFSELVRDSSPFGTYHDSIYKIDSGKPIELDEVTQPKILTYIKPPFVIFGRGPIRDQKTNPYDNLIGPQKETFNKILQCTAG